MKGTFRLLSYYEFTAGYATRNDYVNAFGYTGSAGGLFAVEHM